jgi:hypothetical protein
MFFKFPPPTRAGARGVDQPPVGVRNDLGDQAPTGGRPLASDWSASPKSWLRARSLTTNCRSISSRKIVEIRVKSASGSPKNPHREQLGSNSGPKSNSKGPKIEERQLEVVEIGQFELEIGQLIHS